MKGLLYTLIILGLIAAIAGMLITFKERNKAVSAKRAVEDNLLGAVDMQKQVEKELEAAVKTKEEFEKKAAEQKAQLEQTKAEFEKVQGKIKDALNERDKAMNIRKELEDKREQAVAAKKEAEIKLAEAERRKQEAEARYKTEAFDRQIAETNLENERKAREMTEAEYRKAMSTIKGPEGVARFCSTVISNILVSIMSGDKHYANACEAWNNAPDSTQKYAALDSFDKAKNYYNSALEQTNKLENISKDTEKIKEQLKKIAADNITSTETMSGLLVGILEESEITPSEKETQVRKATDKKFSADKSTLDTCNTIVNLIDTNKDVFTKTQRESLENIKKEIERKFKPVENEQPPKH